MRSALWRIELAERIVAPTEQLTNTVQSTRMRASGFDGDSGPILLCELSKVVAAPTLNDGTRDDSTRMIVGSTQVTVRAPTVRWRCLGEVDGTPALQRSIV